MAIFEAIFPVFAIALVGYLSTTLRLFSARDISAISRFVFVIALPILLFDSLAKIELPNHINWGFLASYYLVAVAVFILSMLVSGKRFSLTAKEQSIFGLGSTYSNTVFVGLPIILSGLGDEALLPLLMLISVNSAVLFFLVSLMAERGMGNGQSAFTIAVRTLKNLLKNPIIIGLILGLFVNLLQIPIPASLANTFGLIGQIALPSALFVLGASLSVYKIGGHYGEAWMMVGIKMLLMPLLVAFMSIIVFQLEPLWTAVAVMTAGMPVGINAYLFSQKYEAGMATMSTAIFLSTALAMISQTLLLVIFSEITQIASSAV